MNRLLLLTTLITVVYSWDELKAVIIFALSGGRRRFGASLASRAVGNALLIATTPAALLWLVIGPGPLAVRLVAVLSQFVLIIALMELISALRWQLAADSAKTAAALIDRESLVSQFLAGSRIISLYVRALLWPVMIGVLLSLAAEKHGTEAVTASVDVLIMVAVIGLVMNVTAKFLSRYLRLRAFNLFSYFRLALGLGIFFSLL